MSGFMELYLMVVANAWCDVVWISTDFRVSLVSTRTTHRTGTANVPVTNTTASVSLTDFYFTKCRLTRRQEASQVYSCGP
ncbi:hypothetical protein C2E23DRAFT_398981 [Lenzites betulinus]|nr:hypothetical protein C2E23DRAFT_398981 [Lenzites betulinus]